MGRWAFRLGCVWVTSIVLTAWVTWKLAAPAAADIHDGAPISSTAALPLSAPAATRTDESGAEEELREQLAAMEAKNIDLGWKYFKLSLEQWAAEGEGATDRSPEEISDTWRAQMAQMELAGGIFDFEQKFSLMFAFAAYGEAGVSHLRGVINNRALGKKERETALEILRYMSSRGAFDAVLDFRDPDLTELDYPYDLIQSHLRTMDRADLVHRFPDIVAQIDADLGRDDAAPERVEVLLSLAFTHGDPAAQRLLRDPRILEENMRGALYQAGEAKTPAALEFLDYMAQNHPDRTVRQSALRYRER